MKRVLLCVSILSLQVAGQFSNSPCPDIFYYKSEGNDVYGIINIKANSPVSSSYILLKTHFMVPVQFDSDLVGYIEAIDSKNLLEKYNAGVTVSYRVHFPVSSPLPRLIALSVNGDLLCHGPEYISSPYQEETAFSLQHMSRLRKNDSFITTRISDIISPSVNAARVSNESPVTHIYYKPNFDELSSPVRFSLRSSSQFKARCGVVSGGNEKHPLIYTGQPLVRGDIPWLVAIYRNVGGTLVFICGGTLVSDRHVVTAAHCMHTRSEFITKKEFVIKVGVYDLDDATDDITVTRSIVTAHIHESYNATTLANNLLIFTMDRSMDFNKYIRPVCLWKGATKLKYIMNASGVMAGWNEQVDLKSTGRRLPKMMHLTFLSPDKCKTNKKNLKYIISDKTFCAGNRDGDDPCRENSGGGLYLVEGGQWRLRGVISKSFRQSTETTCNPKEFIIFTDTAQYISWIRDILRIETYKKSD